MIRLQILEYSRDNTLFLSEWVPFSQDLIQGNENPIEWREPENICQTTSYIYPGEIVKVERLYTFPVDKIWHIGFQIQTEYNWLEYLLVWKRGKSWTTTKIICFDSHENQVANNIVQA